MIATLEGFTQQLVPVNGIKINAVTGGSGPPILLLHGWVWAFSVGRHGGSKDQTSKKDPPATSHGRHAPASRLVVAVRHFPLSG